MKDNKNFRAGYQAALADITVAIENAQVGAEIDAVENWIRNNSEVKESSDNLSQTYRGYWINHTQDKVNCFDIYRNKADVGKINHIDCVESLAWAKATIDNWMQGK